MSYIEQILEATFYKNPRYGHLPSIPKTLHIRRTRHAGHCWRSMNELISNVLLWIPTHGRTSVDWPTRIYLQQLCAYKGCSLEDLPGTMDDRTKTTQARWTRYAGHCWRIKDELISDVLLWTPSRGRGSVGWPPRTCNRSAWTRDEVLKTWRESWMKGTDEKRESRKKVLAACLDDIYIYIYIYI